MGVQANMEGCYGGPREEKKGYHLIPSRDKPDRPDRAPTRVCRCLNERKCPGSSGDPPSLQPLSTCSPESQLGLHVRSLS